MPAYTVVDEQGIELGTVRLEEPDLSVKDILYDEWLREELRETGCECFYLPDESGANCVTCRFVNGEDISEISVKVKQGP